MEPFKKSNKKWIVFGIIIASLAVLVAIGPILVTKYMRYKYNNPKNPVSGELMIKVKGIVKQSANKDKTVYLAGENGLFYVLIGEQTEELLNNIDKTATVFGKMYEPRENEKIEGNPVRLRIEVTRTGFTDLAPLQQ